LSLVEGESNASFEILEPVKDSAKPPKRYGHIMSATRLHIIVFGGMLKNNILANDLWVYSIQEKEWKQFETKDSPVARVYATSSICKQGKTKGMIMLFGGRDAEGLALNDTWGLRRHRDGSWEWVTLI
jgi:protein phosphatase